MFDDVINLLAITYERDSAGNETEKIVTARRVFCRVRSVGRSEFYQAAQTDMHPDYVFVLSSFRDYFGEKELTYKDYTGITKRYSIIRTYRVPDSEALEITAEERVADYG